MNFISAKDAREKVKKPLFKDEDAMRTLVARTLDDIEAAIAKEQYSCPFNHYAVKLEGQTYYKFWEMVDFLKEQGYHVNPIINAKYPITTYASGGISYVDCAADYSVNTNNAALISKYDSSNYLSDLAGATKSITSLPEPSGFEIKGFTISW